MKPPSLLPAAALALLWGSPLFAQPAQVDPSIQPYSKASGVSGNLSSIGSDTLNNLMTFWAEGFGRQYPNVRIQIEGKGSSTAPPALIAGSAQLGPMSRPMKAEELDEFEKRHGYKPSLARVAVDGLAVYVHKDNPIGQLTLQQVDAIFSKTRKMGGKEIRTWGDLGLTGEWAARPISLYGRNSASGTYGFFKELALAKGDYKDTVKEQPGSASVVQGVTEDRFGIGYSGIGYRTSGVKPVALAGKDGRFYGTDAGDVLSGKYPLSRYLYVYYNAAPNRPLDPLVREFLRFVVSREGQETVVKDGYLPISGKIAAEELAKLN
ncbi:MAG: phosphate ABC transporter substrate-binding protein [Thermoanaerobaculia bacterium]|nr:MAG: phosphate ABC transporter substrate-binding protein [Thermoanaerobaculia bacterium]